MHKFPNRHFVLAQRIRAHDLNLLEEVDPSVEDYIRMEEDQSYDIIHGTFHDEMAFEHYEDKIVDLLEVFLELLDVLVIHRIFCHSYRPPSSGTARYKRIGSVIL